ncbi:hypothetical protein ACHWQZ_G010715 [Mnemiopsis leidyi]
MFYLTLLSLLIHADTTAGLSDWITDMTVLKNPDNPIACDLDRFPLDIEMTGSETQKQVWLLGSVDATTPPFPAHAKTRFSISWRQQDRSVWLAYHHTSYGQENLRDNNCWTSMSWRVLKLKRKLVILCHSGEAYKVDYKELYDSTGEQKSIKDLTKSVTHIWFDQLSTDLKVKLTGQCYKGYKMSDDGGCDECPVNTYTDHTNVLGTNTECTPCPDDKVSPPGSTSLDDCQEKGYKIPILGTLVKGQYGLQKPGYMFDDNTGTFYHAQFRTTDPWVKVFFGYEEGVSRVKIINRLDNKDYYKDLENTVVSVMVEGGEDVECGTLTNVNTVSGAVEDQTYTLLCGNQRGIGVYLHKQGSTTGWCISELEFYHFTGMDDACPDSNVYNPDTRSCQAGCPSGKVMQDRVCVECPENTILDLTLGECRQLAGLKEWITDMTVLEDPDNPIACDLDRFPLDIEITGSDTQNEVWLVGLCYKGYKKSDDGGCDECPVNTYTDHTNVLGTNTECTPCPDDKVSPPGSTSLDDCQENGYKIPILGTLVKDQHGLQKPGYMFDDNTGTFYHAQYKTTDPWVKVYFGYEEGVSRVKIINRVDYPSFYKDLENTVVSVMVEGGEDVECGTLTNVNTVSGAVEDQTYTLLCGNQRGIGVYLHKQGSTTGWCISELEFYHFTDMDDACPDSNVYNPDTRSCQAGCPSGKVMQDLSTQAKPGSRVKHDMFEQTGMLDMLG